LRLVVVACVPTDVFTLIKFIILLHILLHGLSNWMILVVVHDVSVRHILRVNTASTLDHWKLLSIEVLIRI